MLRAHDIPGAGQPVASRARGHRCEVDSRHVLLEQAIVDAEIVRTQAELICGESRVVCDAARESLLSSQQGLAAVMRTTQVLRDLLSIGAPDA